MGLIKSGLQAIAKSRWAIFGVIAIVIISVAFVANTAVKETSEIITVAIELVGSDGTQYAGEIEVDEELNLLSITGNSQRVKLAPLTTVSAEVSDLDKTGKINYIITPTVTVKIPSTDKLQSGTYNGKIQWRGTGTTESGLNLSRQDAGLTSHANDFWGFNALAVSAPVKTDVPITLTTGSAYHPVSIFDESTGLSRPIKGTDIDGLTMQFNVSSNLTNPSGGLDYRGSTTFSIELIDIGDSIEIEVTGIDVVVG